MRSRRSTPHSTTASPNWSTGSVYIQTLNGERFVLVQEQHEFEAREKALFNVVLAGFLLSVAGAWGLGWLMARRVMTPVSRLARQVSHRDQLLPLAPALAAEYADDEVGQLAAAVGEDDRVGHLEALDPARVRVDERRLDDGGAHDRDPEVAAEVGDDPLRERLGEGVDVRPAQ
jgi:HAMP domain-containing protein